MLHIIFEHMPVIKWQLLTQIVLKGDKSFYIMSSPNRDKENLFIAVRQFVFLRMCQFFSFPSWLTN